MSLRLHLNAVSLSVLFAIINSAAASPVSTQLLKRHMTSGAKAGLGIGIAVAVVIVILVAVFFFVHMRRQAHNAELDKERAMLSGEKNSDGSDKIDKFAPEPQISSIPRRNKSVKDRLMGPLYRGSMIDLPPIPQKARIPGSNSNRASTMTVGDDASFLNKPWTNGENSPRPSFSSKRATRMMMMM